VSPTKTALVTGAGRGIGRASVLALADAGWRVTAGVRDVPAAEAAFGGVPGVRVTRLDVTEADSVREGVAAAEEWAGGALGCLVSNAGYAVLGAIEEVDLDEVRRMFETNLFGAAAVIQAALPAMREAGGGSLVFVSSIGARISNPLLGMYHASKWGMSAMAEALAVECRPFGIRVTTLEPGMVDTEFPSATRPTGRAPRGEGPYEPLLASLRAGFAEWRRDYPTPAEEVAEAVVAAAEGADGPFRVPVGDDSVRLADLRDGAADDLEWQRRLRGFLRLESWDRTPGG
jgi:NAD(P)-dependent dehydrogenase (short-subunit alcohol dehydrogenase family)